MVCEELIPSSVLKMTELEKECIQPHTWSKSKQQPKEVTGWLWPTLLPVMLHQELTMAFVAVPTKRSQHFCPKSLHIYEEYHSLSLIKCPAKHTEFSRISSISIYKNFRMFSMVLHIWITKQLTAILFLSIKSIWPFNWLAFKCLYTSLAPFKFLVAHYCIVWKRTNNYAHI